jgi:hypothetical protein
MKAAADEMIALSGRGIRRTSPKASGLRQKAHLLIVV